MVTKTLHFLFLLVLGGGGGSSGSVGAEGMGCGGSEARGDSTSASPERRFEPRRGPLHGGDFELIDIPVVVVVAGRRRGSRPLHRVLGAVRGRAGLVRAATGVRHMGGKRAGPALAPCAAPP